MEDRSALPKYNVAGQPSLSMEPPFSFYGVTMRIFPLCANMLRLTRRGD